ncbi:MAG TPA: protein kinase [Pyrinomonadaceae bacterium]|jgi:serine/threonine protein kinase
MPFANGTRIGRYVIQSLLGSGGMGEVYLARDLKLERSVALKVLHAVAQADPRAVQRFFKEARAASALSHPNVAYIYEVEEAEGVNFIALEYVQGETLRARLRKSRMSLSDALDVALQVCGALAAAHERGIVHRDIKPENIMVTGEGHVKVLDFGLAKVSEATPHEEEPNNSTVSRAFSEPGVMMGTVAYMSPEQARGLTMDARTDIWSLGVVFHEMIAGRTPFEGASNSDIIAAILHQPPLPLARFSREVTEAVEWVALKALAKDRAERYETAREMHIDLRRLKRRLETGAEGERTSLEALNSGGASVPGGSWPPQRASSTESSPKDAPPASPSSTHSMSSAEYIVSTLHRHRKVSVAAILCFVAAATLGVYLLTAARTAAPAAPPQRLILNRLTFEQGLQGSPTWSPDGQFIAYSSDRDGNFDIWVKSASSGDPLRITDSPEHDWQPNWSPDGTLIVFRSERDGGGLYFTSAPFGKRVRKISSFGYNPRWSPDGSRILFLRQGMRLNDRPRVYVLDKDGASAPHEVLTSPMGDERGVRRGALAWHPDSRRVSYWGEDRAFYTIPIEGGTPVKSEVSEEVAARMRKAAIDWGAFQWSPSGASLYLEGRSNGVLNLWRIQVDPKSMQWTGGPERLTTSDGQDTEIALARDGRKLAYTKKSQGTSLWLLPFDARRGLVKGEGHPVTPKDVEAWFPDISPDGRKLVYSVIRQGQTKHEIWEKSLVNSEQRLLSEVEGAVPFNPRWSPDSTRIAYSRHELIPPRRIKRGGSVVILDSASGAEQTMASHPPAGEASPWRDYNYDWSPDGQWVLVSSDRGSPERWYIAMLPLDGAPNAELKLRKVLEEANVNLWTPRFSPDGRWITFLKQDPNETASSVLYVAPASGGAPVRVTDEKAWADKPRWSPDGRTLYFIYNQNSYFLNVYGIRFDPEQGRTVGEPFRVTNLGSPARMVAASLSYLEISLNRDFLVLPITETNGNIWVLEDLIP